MYTFSELKNRVAIIAQRKNDTDYLTKIVDWLNFAQEYAYRAYDYYVELEDKFVFNTASGTEAYYMPSSFDKPMRVYNMTNNNKLSIWTEEDYEDTNLANISGAITGTPNKSRFYGISPVQRIIAAAGVTTKVKSSSSSDIAGVVVRIEGYVDAALTVIDYENITISSSAPTSYITATTPKTFYKYTRIAKSADTTGFITIADNSSNVLAIIASTERQSRYPVLNLGLIPNAVMSMRVLFKRRINKMVDDNDYPFIDADEFHITYATAYAYIESKETADQSTAMFAKADKILLEVIRNQQGRLGEDFQHKMSTKFLQAHRV